ncbi:hypothetical protein K438DRAFT_1962445 [Mycena galopus ATCC 62051]|nr:hypothetical protein K438DRAFT_1962445 [Mycena galopus ATCC 62051]
MIYQDIFGRARTDTFLNGRHLEKQRSTLRKGESVGLEVKRANEKEYIVALAIHSAPVHVVLLAKVVLPSVIGMKPEYESDKRYQDPEPTSTPSLAISCSSRKRRPETVVERARVEFGVAASEGGEGGIGGDVVRETIESAAEASATVESSTDAPFLSALD